ncbi:MAG: helix-turn-helix transcriptional regulator [Anaerolineales bacterium]
MAPKRSVAYEGNLLRIGSFRCSTEDPDFNDSGPTLAHLVVFPRTSVSITSAGSEPVIADPNIVMFYNRGQEYRREAISERGDHCEWYAFHPQILLDALRTYDPEVEDHDERPFQLDSGPSNSNTYLQQRLVFRHIAEEPHPDTLYVEETMLCVLQHILDDAYRVRRHQRRRGMRQPKHYEEITRAVQQLLATRFQEHLTLEDIAAEINYSPYHLARIFRQQTGQTIHAYLNQIRLRTALDYLQSGTDLTQLALTLGFSSHSHFTQAFRKAFGTTPSQLRPHKGSSSHYKRARIR